MKKILIVDDDKVFTYVLSKSLQPEYYVVTANDEHSAINAFLEQDFDLILMDILLPDGISGIALAKKFLTHKHVSIVAMSGYVTEDVIKLAPKIFKHYLQKPFTLEELKEVIHAEVR